MEVKLDCDVRDFEKSSEFDKAVKADSYVYIAVTLEHGEEAGGIAQWLLLVWRT